jgi:hypothetical protein
MTRPRRAVPVGAGDLRFDGVEVRGFEPLTSSVRDLLGNYTDVIHTREVGEGS